MLRRRKHRLLLLLTGLLFLFLFTGMSASAKTGLVKSSGNWYYYSGSGTLVKSKWIFYGSHAYYASSDGSLLTSGIYKVGQYSYLFNARGEQQRGKITYKKKTYFFSLTNGRMQKSAWVKVNGKYYYFAKNGVMATGKWIGRYYVGKKGYRLTNRWLGSRYLGSDGKALRGLQEIDGVYYFFNKKTWNKVVNKTKTVNGDTYEFDSEGVGTLVATTNIKTTSVSVESTYYSDGYADDETLLAAIIYCEAGNQSYAGKMAVGMVIMNRVYSALFPSTVREVIYQKSQFGPASSGKMTVALKNYSTVVTDECKMAAAEVLAKYDGYVDGSTTYLTVKKKEVTFPYLFFMTKSSYDSLGLTAKYKKIGSHVFFKTWK